MQFADIPGLQDLKKQLIAAFNKGKVAHAQLFAGRPGTAVLPMTLAYASYLMCSNRKEEDSCGTCPNCVRIKKLVHPDMHLYFPKVSASDSGKYEKVLAEALPKFRDFVGNQPFGDLEDWAKQYGEENKNLLIGREDSRQLLKNVSMRSVEGGYKILFMWYPEMMNANAANAILKVLEEPPEQTIYLIASYNYDSLLATITSRTQLVTVPPNSLQDIAHFLDKSMGINGHNGQRISRLSEGKVGAAIKLAGQENGTEYQTFQQWMLDCWKQNYTSLVRKSEDFSKVGKTMQRSMLNYAITILRNAVSQTAGQEPSVFDEEEKQFISRFADSLGVNKLEKVYLLINQSLHHLDRNANPRIIHLNLSLDIIRTLNG